MSKDIKGNNKHLSLDDRITIEQSLKEGRSFRQIALELSKDPSTISKEVKLHRVLVKHSRFNSDDNDCDLRYTCKRKGVCTNLKYRCDRKLCHSCFRCNRACPDFTPTCYDCPQTLKAPFVCNGCKKKTHCRFDRFTYTALIADKQYHSLLIDSRTGIDMTHERLLEIDTVISPLVKQGQSPYLIHEAHPGLGISIKTMYNYINNGSLSVKDLDLYKKDFCNPMRSVQKSGCEENHEFIRKVLPKGSSFDSLTQFDIDRLSWHINSTKRASLNGMTPFRLASLLLNEQVIKAFNLREIAPNQVLLTPELLKK